MNKIIGDLYLHFAGTKSHHKYVFHNEHMSLEQILIAKLFDATKDEYFAFDHRSMLPKRKSTIFRRVNYK